MTLTLYDVLGAIGTIAIALAYFGTQAGWMRADGRAFPAINLGGAVLMFISLLADWNFPAFLMEIFWIAVSFYGLARHWRGARPA